MKKVFTSIFMFTIVLSYAQDFTRSESTGLGFGNFEVVDFNSDGFPDLVGVDFNFNNQDELYVAINNGDSPTTYTSEVILVTNITGNPTTGDIDGDGDMDILYTNEDTDEINSLINDGAQNFTNIGLSIFGINRLKFTDLDGDGNPDIIGINRSTDYMLINFRLPDGTNQSLDISFDEDVQSFDVVDLDGNTFADIVVGFEEFDGKQVSLVNFNNFFLEEEAIISNKNDGIVQVKFHDLNGDDDQDIVILWDDGLSVWLNESNNFFDERLLVEAGFSDNVRSFDIADYDGDQIDDIVWGTNSNGIFWFNNTGADDFVYEKKEVGTVSPAFQLNSADIDLDGDLDILAANGDYWYYENNLGTPSSNQELIQAQITLAPNPATDYIEVMDTKQQYISYSIMNIDGKVLRQADYTSSKIDLSDLSHGTYMISLININAQQSVVQFIKK